MLLFFGDEIKFVIHGTEIIIPRTCLLSAKSPHFDLLLKEATGPFYEASGHPIQLKNIDIENFQLLKEWLLSPSEKIFKDIEFMKGLAFIAASHQFEIPGLILDCDVALEKKVSKENAIELFNQFIEFQKKIDHLDIQLSKVKEGLIRELEKHHLTLTSWSKDNVSLIVGKLNEQKEFSFPEIPFFQEVESLSLDLTNVKILNDRKREELLSTFPNTEQVRICFNRNGAPNWDFLKNFKKLQKVIITSLDKINKNWIGKFKRNFPKENSWNISFDISRFSSQESIKKCPYLSIENFIQLKLLETEPTSFHQWPKEYTRFMIDQHLNKLLKANKIDLEASILDLRGFSNISLNLMKEIVNKMPKLEEANFLLDPLSPLLTLYPTISSRLKKVTFPLSYFCRDSQFSVLNFFMSQTKTGGEIVIVVDTQERTISPVQLFANLKLLSSLKIKFLQYPNFVPQGEVDSKGRYIELEPQVVMSTKDPFTAKIKLGESLENNSIQRDSGTFHLAFFSEILKYFTNLRWILDLTNLPSKHSKYYSDDSLSENLLGLATLFPDIYELQTSFFDENMLVKFPKLKILSFSSLPRKSAEFKNLSGIEDLSHVNALSSKETLSSVDIVYRKFGNDLYLEDFIKKARKEMGRLPSFQATKSLNKNFRAELIDDDLRRMRPLTCNSYLDFSGMKSLSHQVVVEFIKALKAPVILDGCTRIFEEINQNKISIDHFMLMALAWSGNFPIFSETNLFFHYRKRMTDQHIEELIDAKKIKKIPNHIFSPHFPTLDLSGMALIGPHTFIKIMSITQPVRLILTDVAPDLYSTLLDFAKNLDSITLPYKVYKDKNYLNTFLKNFIRPPSTKEFHVRIELEDLMICERDDFFKKREEFSKLEIGLLFPKSPIFSLIYFFHLHVPNDINSDKLIETLKASSFSKFFDVCPFLPERIQRDLSDDDLYILKPEQGFKIQANFMGYSQITGEGLIRYLDGLEFDQLTLSGCSRITENDLERIRALYPTIQIIPPSEYPSSVAKPAGGSAQPQRAPVRSRYGQAHSPPSKRPASQSPENSRSRSPIAIRSRLNGTD